MNYPTNRAATKIPPHKEKRVRIFLKAMHKALLLAVFLLLGGVLCTPQCAQAFRTEEVTTAAGKPFLRFSIYDAGEEYDADEHTSSTWTLGQNEIQSVLHAGAYWGALLGPGARNTAFADITLATYDRQNADASSKFSAKYPLYTDLGSAIIVGDTDIGSPLALIHLGQLTSAGWNTGPLEILPHMRNGLPDLSSVITHELGHAFGIMAYIFTDVSTYRFAPTLTGMDRYLADSWGKPAQANMAIVNDDTQHSDAFTVSTQGTAFFVGPTVREVLNGKTFSTSAAGVAVSGIPINGFELDDHGEKFPELSHIELRNSMMSHQKWRNWGTFMEAELALLQDISYTIERKNFFGFSEYRDGQTYPYSKGYGALTADGSYADAYNTTPLGIGLHVYGGDNTIAVTGKNILTTGQGAAGIRIDGSRNTLTVDRGTAVQADGPLGTGIMTAYGVDNNVVVRGAVSSVGQDGVALRFDFGNNILGNGIEFRGSLMRTSGNANAPLIWGENDGALARTVDISGALSGSSAAIYIAPTAYVQYINLLGQAAVVGDIISQWDNTDVRIQANNPSMAVTDLIFGRAMDSATGMAATGVDADFSGTVHGNILGPQSLNVSLVGGVLHLAGSVDAATFTMNPQTVLDLDLASSYSIKADRLQMDTGSTVAVSGHITRPFTYGAKLASGDTLPMLRLEGASSMMNNAGLKEDNFSGTQEIGFYRYDFSGAQWVGDKTAIATTIRTKNFMKDVGGVAAVTAPLAVSAQLPANAAVQDRSRAIFMLHNPALQKSAQWAGLTTALTADDIKGYALERRARQREAAPYARPQKQTDTAMERVAGAVAAIDAANVDTLAWAKNAGGASAGFGPGAVWITPSLSYDSGGAYTKYGMTTPGVSFGFDSWCNDTFFLGAAVSFAKSRYTSEDADVDGNSIAGTLYGGLRLPLGLELDGAVTYARIGYDQNREVRGQEYNADYTSDTWSVGGTLSRPWALNDSWMLRPFVAYEYSFLRTEDYTENDGLYALHVKAADRQQYRLRTGAELATQWDGGAFLAGRVFYAGLYGDREGEARIRYSLDPAGNTITAYGDSMDEHALGLGLRFAVPIADKVEVSAGCTVLTGRNNTHGQGSLSVLFAF